MNEGVRTKLLAKAEKAGPATRAVIVFTAEEDKKISDWLETHHCHARLQHEKRCKEQPHYAGTSFGGVFGGTHKYIVHPLSVGQLIHVRCICGEQLEDVTELAENW